MLTTEVPTYCLVGITGRMGGGNRATTTLPDGTVQYRFTLIVDRPKAAREGSTKVDAIPCVTTDEHVATKVDRLEAGEIATAHGTLRRRFRRSANDIRSSLEVEVSSLVARNPHTA